MGADLSCCWGSRDSDKPPRENARNGASDEVASFRSNRKVAHLGHSVPNLPHEHLHGHHHHKHAQGAGTVTSDRWTTSSHSLPSLVQEELWKERNAGSSIDAQPHHRHHHEGHTKDHRGDVMPKAALTHLGQSAPSVLDEHHHHHHHHLHHHHLHHEHPSSSEGGSADKRNHGMMSDRQEQLQRMSEIYELFSDGRISKAEMDRLITELNNKIPGYTAQQKPS